MHPKAKSGWPEPSPAGLFAPLSFLKPIRKQTRYNFKKISLLARNIYWFIWFIDEKLIRRPRGKYIQILGVWSITCKQIIVIHHSGLSICVSRFISAFICLLLRCVFTSCLSLTMPGHPTRVPSRVSLSNKIDGRVYLLLFYAACTMTSDSGSRSPTRWVLIVGLAFCVYIYACVYLFACVYVWINVCMHTVLLTCFLVVISIGNGIVFIFGHFPGYFYLRILVWIHFC